MLHVQPSMIEMLVLHTGMFLNIKPIVSKIEELCVREISFPMFFDLYIE